MQTSEDVLVLVALIHLGSRKKKKRLLWMESGHTENYTGEACIKKMSQTENVA